MCCTYVDNMYIMLKSKPGIRYGYIAAICAVDTLNYINRFVSIASSSKQTS